MLNVALTSTIRVILNFSTYVLLADVNVAIAVMRYVVEEHIQILATANNWRQ